METFEPSNTAAAIRKRAIGNENLIKHNGKGREFIYFPERQQFRKYEYTINQNQNSSRTRLATAS